MHYSRVRGREGQDTLYMYIGQSGVTIIIFLVEELTPEYVAKKAVQLAKTMEESNCSYEKLAKCLDIPTKTYSDLSIKFKGWQLAMQLLLHWDTLQQQQNTRDKLEVALGTLLK